MFEIISDLYYRPDKKKSEQLEPRIICANLERGQTRYLQRIVGWKAPCVWEEIGSELQDAVDTIDDCDWLFGGTPEEKMARRRRGEEAMAKHMEKLRSLNALLKCKKE
jgi:hypothetical protein